MKSNPINSGDSLKSKPAWSNTLGYFATPASLFSGDARRMVFG